MKIDIDAIRARVAARVQAAADRRRGLLDRNIAELSPSAYRSRPRGVTIARILPWRRKDDNAPEG